MKKLTFTLLSCLILINALGQIDDHGNPVFNSIQISEEKYDNFEMTSSYYTIDNNISNKSSSVFVSDNPTLNDYLKFARDLPSNFFIIHEGQNVLIMIMLIQKNEGSKTSLFYNIINPNNGKNTSVDCNIFGEISEKRAAELTNLKIDTTASVIDLPNNGKGLLFNGIVYRIQPYDKLKTEVIGIVNQLLSPKEEKKDVEAYIKNETINGKLDFNKILENEKQSLFLYDGVAYNKKDFAIYLWGKKVKILGITSAKKAVNLWKEIYKRELTVPEKKALSSGFESNTK